MMMYYSVLLALSSERITYLVSIQKDLQRECSKGYAAVHASCKQFHSSLQGNYPDIPSLDDASALQGLNVDEISHNLLPPDSKHFRKLLQMETGTIIS